MKKYNSNSKNRELAYNGVGSGGGGGVGVKSISYTGNGTEEKTEIVFPVKPKYILSMDATMPNGVKLHHNGFTPYEDGSCGTCVWIGGGTGAGNGIYTWDDSTKTLTITGFNNINERLNTLDMIANIYYL